MVNVKIIGDDRFDPNLPYTIEGEIVGNDSGTACEKCASFADCQGWAMEFGRCQEEKQV